MAVTASFLPNAGVLTTIGDSLNNSITTSRNAAGSLLVNGGAVAIQGGQPTVANTSLIQAFGQGGNDTLTLDQTNGALPRANLFGGSGDDTVTGGAGGDQLFGQSENDTLLGKGGFDFLFGGDGNDVLTGGDGDDQMFGESGDDRMIWSPGDDTDLAEGGAGTDTVEVNGGGGAEVFTVTANGTRVRFDRLDPAPFAIDIGTSEAIVLNAGAGDDRFSATGNLDALIDLVVDGGAGNDVLLGGNGGDVFLGGDGNDFIDGQQGEDVAFLGAGDDVFQWDPGDGNDVLEGQDGSDRMLFNGSGASEGIDVFANGGRVVFFRDVGTVVMDLDNVERVEFAALGGTDRVTVRDLSGTDVTRVAIDLAGTPGGSAGDAAADRVVVEGTAGADVVSVGFGGDGVLVRGLDAEVSVDHAEIADRLTIQGFGGDDRIDASAMPGGTMALTLDGGAGSDTLTGGTRSDLLVGGAGRDVMDGGLGADDFDFDALSDSALHQRDAIIGFAHKIDDIDLATIDANTTVAGDQAFDWIGRGLFTGVAGQLRVNASGWVLGDVNGDGLADIAIKVSGAVLTVGDFVL